MRLPSGWPSVTAEGRAQPFVTWVIGGIGALMTIVMVRRRPVVAWTGMAILAVSTSLWLGPLEALSLGLVDQLAYPEQVLADLAKRAGLTNPKFVRIERQLSPFEALLGADASAVSKKVNVAGVDIAVDAQTIDRIARPQMMYMWLGR